MSATREEVYEAINGERAYQVGLWNEEPRRLDEFILYLDVYCRRAADATTAGDEDQAAHEVRKIAALAVACMEQHGAPRR